MAVVDFAHGVAGAFAARLFAQLGADVSRPGIVGEGRSLAQARGCPEAFQDRLGAYLNAGKSRPQGELDLSDGSRVVESVGHASFVIHDRGRDFSEAVLAAPELAGCAVIALSPFGWEGPYAPWKCDQLVLQSLAGIATLVGDERREPLMLPGFSVEYAAGTLAFIAGMAMRMRPESMERHVLVTEFEAAATLHQFTYLSYTRLGWVRKRSQFMLPTATYFHCLDGDIVVAAVRPNQWEAVARACDQPELLTRPEFKTFLERRLYADSLMPWLTPWFAQRTCEKAFAALCSAGAPAAIVKTPAQAFDDPQFAWRQFIGHDSAGKSTLPLPFLINGQRPQAVSRDRGYE